MEPIEDILKNRHRELAGVIIEPIMQAAAGMIPQPPGYLKRLRELCTGYNVLLIVDEVATGFGRTGRMFACDHEEVTPDLMALSKGLTGGYMPLAATLTTDTIYQGFLGRYDEFKTFFHGHSFTGNPLGCSVAIANLQVFRQEKTLARLASKIKFFSRLLAPLAAISRVGNIRQRGFMVGIELVKDKTTKAPYPLSAKVGHRVAAIARSKGLILRPIGNVLVLMPPLSMSLKDMTRMVNIIKESIEALQID
jgi:adenosylmethionine-8-amino-7-oxononanoate aminotransferase